MQSDTSSGSISYMSSLGSPTDGCTRGAQEIEYLGNVVLVMAYVVAVAFYLSLLSSFLLHYLDLSNPDLERSLTTALLLFIAGVGYLKGLGGLERLESFSVTIQLSVIVSLLVGLAIFGFGSLSGKEIHFDYPERDALTQLQILAGALLVVQGFETSRFLGDKYTREVRVTSMRNAQIISGLLYVVSVLLLMPVVQTMDLAHVKLSEIIDAMQPVALILPMMLMLAALTSQFSAAVADLGGGGGLLRGEQPWPPFGQGRICSGLGVCDSAGMGRRPARNHHDRLQSLRVLLFPADVACHHLQLQGLPADCENDGIQ